MYLATLEHGTDLYKGKGETAIEALQNLNIDYTQVKLKGTVKLQKGELKSERFMYKLPLRRFIANKMARIQLAKYMEQLLK